MVEETEKGEIRRRVRRESPELIDKEGVLVVRSKAVGDLMQAVENER